MADIKNVYKDEHELAVLDAFDRGQAGRPEGTSKKQWLRSCVRRYIKEQCDEGFRSESEAADAAKSDALELD